MKTAITPTHKTYLIRVAQYLNPEMTKRPQKIMEVISGRFSPFKTYQGSKIGIEGSSNGTIRVGSWEDKVHKDYVTGALIYRGKLLSVGLDCKLRVSGLHITRIICKFYAPPVGIKRSGKTFTVYFQHGATLQFRLCKHFRLHRTRNRLVPGKVLRFLSRYEKGYRNHQRILGNALVYAQDQ